MASNIEPLSPRRASPARCLHPAFDLRLLQVVLAAGVDQRHLATDEPAHAKAAGLELLDEYRYEGVSGTKELEHREGLSELLARIRSNGVRIVIVERADRIARDLLVGEVILGQFRDLGVRRSLRPTAGPS